MAKTNPIVVGLDIGTTKIACLVGEVTPAGEVNIIGVGTHPSFGLRKGVVVNIDKTVDSIRHAVNEAAMMSGIDITSVTTGIAGSHIASLNSSGVVAVNNPKEISQKDIERVLEAASTHRWGGDRHLLHVVPQEFIVDDQDGITEPVGMAGTRLEAHVHIVTGAVTSVDNIIKCCQRCGLDVEDIVLEQKASAMAVLTDDERELGVCVVDIGGGTTDIAIFTSGALRHTGVKAVGGAHVTNDIAVGLSTPMQEAERIKVQYGIATVEGLGEGEDIAIEVPSVGDRESRQISRHVLASIIEARLEELFELVRQEIESSGYGDLIASGVVLTGGASQMPGCVELAEDVLGRPVRMGKPRYVGGLKDVVNTPIHATGTGLLLHAAKQRAAEQQALFPRGSVRGRREKAGLLGRMRQWIEELF